jgi:hypothetical protein
MPTRDPTNVARVNHVLERTAIGSVTEGIALHAGSAEALPSAG